MSVVSPRILAGVMLSGALLLLPGCGPAAPSPAITPAAWVAEVPPAPSGGGLPAAFYAEAERTREQAVAGTGDPAALRKYAGLLHASGFFAEAAVGWRLVAAQDASDPQARYFLADAYRNMGYEEEAQAVLLQALALDPGYVKGWLRAGEFQLKRGQVAAAHASFTAALAMVPDSLPGRLGLAQAEARAGQVEAAIERLRGVYADAPGFGSAATVLAGLLEQQGAAAEAERVRRQAAGASQSYEAADPWLSALYAESYDADRLVLWGNYAEHARRPAEAARFFERAMARAPAASAAYQFMGQLLAENGSHAEAVAVLQEGVKLDDASEGMFVRLIESLMILQRQAAAQAAAEAGLARFGESALVENARGRVLVLQGRRDEAMAAFDRALSWLPNYADPALNQALVHLQTGDRAAAEAAIDEALRRQPAFPRARILRAQIAMGDGDLMAALDQLQAAYQQSPGVPDVRTALARWFETAIEDRLAAGDRVMAERLARQGGVLLPEVAEALSARLR